MTYSDSLKTILAATINEFALNPNNYALNPGKDFSRNRKLGFKDVSRKFIAYLLCVLQLITAKHYLILIFFTMQ